MANHDPEHAKLVSIGFGDVVQFATYETQDTAQPLALTARFVITGTFEDEQKLFAAKIIDTDGPERLSRPGTMDPPVRKIEEESWDLGRIAAAMAWQLGLSADNGQLRETLAPAAEAQPVEFPAF